MDENVCNGEAYFGKHRLISGPGVFQGTEHKYAYFT
jgi:hypothetical protein